MSATAKPVVAKPVVAKPVVAKPVVAKPSVAKPSVAKPSVAKPSVAKPSVAKPSVAKPSVAKPSVAKPSVAKPKGVLHYVGVGLSIGLFGLVLLLALITIVVPKVAGATPLTILTISMEPKLPPGTLIVVKSEPLKDIRIGDVMTYQIRSGDPAVISHRVIAINHSSTGGLTFVTKGDNNSVADPVVIEKQVRGVLWYSVPYIGWVSSAVNGSQRSWIVPAIALALLAYAAYMITSGAIGATRKRRGGESGEPAKGVGNTADSVE
jgi:signal peptidase